MESKRSGPSCSKLTTSLVNDSLNLHRVIRKYAKIFCWKNVKSYLHFFSKKYRNFLGIESAKIVNEMVLNEFVKLTTLWTTGPWWYFVHAQDDHDLSILRMLKGIFSFDAAHLYSLMFIYVTKLSGQISDFNSRTKLSTLILIFDYRVIAVINCRLLARFCRRHPEFSNIKLPQTQWRPLRKTLTSGLGLDDMSLAWPAVVQLLVFIYSGIQ